MSGPTVLCAGLSCIDFLWQVERFPPEASRTHATAFRQQGGGPAATAAVTVARLGGTARLWALHGDDVSGAAAREELEREGVDTSGVRTLQGGTTFTSAVLVAPSGERWIFPYRGDGLVDDPAPFSRANLERADAVLVDFRHPRICAAAVEGAKAAGIPTVADVSNERVWALAGDVDVLIASEEAAAEVLGRRDPEAALAALRHREDQQVGITLGPEGYVWLEGDEARYLTSLPVDVIDTTGAGDVFHGAYAYALGAGWTAERCAMFASVTAAVSCTGLGREAIPTAAAVERLLEMRTLREMNERDWT